MARIPEEFLKRMASLLGEETEPFAQALCRPEPPAIRVNTLKVAPQRFAERSPFPLEPVPWCPEGFLVLDTEARPALHPYHAAGLYYIQDAAAMLSKDILAPQPGDWVLDLCAAPGGKTTHLAAAMQNRGVLVANDPNPRRLTVLARNLERMGVTCAVVLQEEPERLAERFAGLFDRVLVDAPCSGESTLASDPEARRRWSPKAICRMASLQSHILEQAARLVRPGGYLLYATCTFSPEENEEVIASFIREHPDFSLAEAKRHRLFDKGHPGWSRIPLPELELAVRLWPHRGPGKGHFYALLRRKEGTAPARPSNPCSFLTPEAEKAYLEFCERCLTAAPAADGLVIWNGGIYRTPLPLEMLAGLRLLRPGWWLGSLRDGRFVPDHALALGMRPGQAKSVLSFSPSDPHLRAYLRGEEIAATAEGWVLVAVEEFPLGWGYCRQGRLKNFYPRHWRLL